MRSRIVAEITRLDAATVRLAVSGASEPLSVHRAANPFAPPSQEPWLLLAAQGPVDLAWPEAAGRAAVMLAGDGALHFVGERHVAFERVTNCRDLGGYEAADGRRVRWGHLFRSADLADASPRDVETLASLGINLVCDFRTAEEARKAPDRLPDGIDAYLNLPLGQSELAPEDAAAILSGSLAWLEGGGMTRIYLAWIETCAPLWAELLARLARANDHAALFHCMAGKDRTGAFVAVLLAVLGVRDEDILADHQLSNQAILRLEAAAGVHRQPARHEPEIVLPGLPTPAEALQTFLDAIRADFGSVLTYLARRGGMDRACVARLRDRFLE